MRWRSPDGASDRAAPFGVRDRRRCLVLAALGVVYAAVAVIMWAWPGEVSEHGPITAGPLGLRFVGSWAAFLALTAAYAATAPAVGRSPPARG